MRAKYTGPTACQRCNAHNGTYVATPTSTIACSEKITGFTGDANETGLNDSCCKLEYALASSVVNAVREWGVVVITQLGAFSLQFRSRSGSVFVARWRSGLTIAEFSYSVAHIGVLYLVPQKKRYNFIWQRAARRDATPERLLCVFHVYVYRRTRTRGALNALVARYVVINSAQFLVSFCNVFIVQPLLLERDES